MQQYRLNYGLLIGLAVGTLVAAVATYGLWKFQVNRNAGAVLAEAKAAEEAGDLHAAAKEYTNYLTIRPKETEIRVKLANVWADVTESPDMAPEDLGQAIFFLEESVRSMPDEKALQRRLVDLYGRYNQWQQALDHLSHMVVKYPDDAELQSLYMQYLVHAGKYDDALKYGWKLIGYDSAADSFDESKATAPHDVDAYSTLAMVLRSNQDKKELADRVMNQMIKANPKSSDAYLVRGRYYYGFDEPDKGTRDIEKASALNPDDADVLIAMADLARKGKRLDKSREFYERGEKKYPQDARFYQGLASLVIDPKDTSKALEALDRGLKAVPTKDARMLMLAKADFQIQNKDIKGARETTELMRRSGFRPDIVEWIEARILLTQNKWFEASQALSRLQPKLKDLGDLPEQIDYQLGLCYEHMGLPDKALQSYMAVLQHNPDNEPAAAGKQRILLTRGMPTGGKEDDKQLEQQITEILAKPKAEQNWAKIDAQLTELVEKRKLEGATRDLFWAQIMLARGDFAKARTYLVDGRKKDPENLQIQRAAVLLLRADPSQGPDKANKLLDQVTSHFGDQALVRLDRADIFIAKYQKTLNAPELKDQLAKLGDAPADWTDDAKVDLWSGLAGRYIAIGQRDQARQMLDQVLSVRPMDLPTATMLFALALEANDDVGMRTAQDKILKIVGSKGDSNWLFTEARRMISLYRRGQLGRDALAEVRIIVGKALDQRPDWFELHLVKAELEMLDGNNAVALEHFNKAEELGRPSPAAVLQHVRLLVSNGDYQEAKKRVEQLPKETREGDLGQVYADILVNSGDLNGALEVAEKYAAAAPDDGARQLAYGQLLARCAVLPGVPEDKRKSLLKTAGVQLQKAVELSPDAPEAWLALLSYHALENDMAGAVATVQKAQLVLTEDQLTGVLAKSYELLGEWFSAENMYLSLYRANPDNPRVAQELATFYLGEGYPRPDKQVKALPMINKILHAGADGKLPPNDPGVMWARRMGAQLLAATGDYQKRRKAEALLASNVQGGRLATEDQLWMAQILAPRPEPVSRFKAMKLLENLNKSERLNLPSELVLGQLYYASGDAYWPKCKRQLLQTVSRYPDSPDARGEFIRVLLLHGDKSDFAEAAKQLAKLRELAPNDIRTLRYTIQLAGKTGREAGAREYLKKLLPKVNDPKDIKAEDLTMIDLIASLMIELNDLDSAEKVYRMMAARDPNRQRDLAQFLGRYRDVGQAMDLLAASYKPSSAEQTVQVGIDTIRKRRDEIGDKYDEKVRGWLDRALLENPDSISLMMLQAEFYDIQKKYDEAAAIYQKLLARSDLVGLVRAIVLNNLAFLVSLANNATEVGVDPLKLVQEARDILGPTSDILDTRAVVYIAQQKYQDAIRDLEFAVTDSPTPSKYFHKAVAHLGAGENSAALDAWQKANELGPIRDDLNRLEYGRFDQMKAKIDQLQGKNVSRAGSSQVPAAR